MNEGDAGFEVNFDIIVAGFEVDYGVATVVPPRKSGRGVLWVGATWRTN